jgi:dolichol-phosphate mannosyltransferase
LPGAIAWLGFPTSTIDIEQQARFAGRSGYTFRKLLRLAASSIVAYSDRPLRLTVKCGLIFSTMSVLLGLGLIFDHLFGGQRLPGWSSILVSIYLVGGMIMASVGVLGLYIGRIYDLARGRPAYVISAAVPRRNTLKHYFARPLSGDELEINDRLPDLEPVGSHNRPAGR